MHAAHTQTCATCVCQVESERKSVFSTVREAMLSARYGDTIIVANEPPRAGFVHMQQGSRVWHSRRGSGTLLRIDQANEGGKPYIVEFDSGDTHEHCDQSMLKFARC